MKLLIDQKSSRVWIGRTSRPFSFSSPMAGGEFALLLVVGDEGVTPVEQGALSEQIVDQGCRYVVCTGHECSSWDDSIDMVGVMDEVEGRSAPFVMTTWHEDESVAEVVEYFATCTRFDDWVAEEFVVLLVGGASGLEAEVRAALEECFG